MRFVLCFVVFAIIGCHKTPSFEFEELGAKEKLKAELLNLSYENAELKIFILTKLQQSNLCLNHSHNNEWFKVIKNKQGDIVLFKLTPILTSSEKEKKVWMQYDKGQTFIFSHNFLRLEQCPKVDE